MRKRGHDAAGCRLADTEWIADGKHEVNIEMTMTSPMCPAGPQLVAGTKGAAEGLEEVASCEVKVVMEPAWSPELMTDEARDHLGIF